MTCQVHPSQHPRFHAAIDSEHRDAAPHDAGHLVMPNGSMVSSADYAFLTAAAPYVLALHLAARVDTPGDGVGAMEDPTGDDAGYEPEHAEDGGDE